MAALFTTPARLNHMRRILNIRHFYRSVKLFSRGETEEIESFLDNYTDLEFRPLRMKTCIFGESFTNARIHYDELYFTDPSTGRESVPTIELKTLFHHGMQKLETFVKGEFKIGPHNKENQDFLSSVLALHSFLRNINMLTKKPATLKAFIEDVKWLGDIAALDEHPVKDSDSETVDFDKESEIIKENSCEDSKAGPTLNQVKATNDTESENSDQQEILSDVTPCTTPSSDIIKENSCEGSKAGSTLNKVKATNDTESENSDQQEIQSDVTPCTTRSSDIIKENSCEGSKAGSTLNKVKATNDTESENSDQQEIHSDVTPCTTPSSDIIKENCCEGSNAGSTLNQVKATKQKKRIRRVSSDASSNSDISEEIERNCSKVVKKRIITFVPDSESVDCDTESENPDQQEIHSDVTPCTTPSSDIIKENCCEGSKVGSTLNQIKATKKKKRIRRVSSDASLNSDISEEIERNCSKVVKKRIITLVPDSESVDCDTESENLDQQEIHSDVTPCTTPSSDIIKENCCEGSNAGSTLNQVKATKQKKRIRRVSSDASSNSDISEEIERNCSKVVKKRIITFVPDSESVDCDTESENPDQQEIHSDVTPCTTPSSDIIKENCCEGSKVGSTLNQVKATKKKKRIRRVSSDASSNSDISEEIERNCSKVVKKRIITLVPDSESVDCDTESENPDQQEIHSDVTPCTTPSSDIIKENCCEGSNTGSTLNQVKATKKKKRIRRVSSDASSNSDISEEIERNCSKDESEDVIKKGTPVQISHSSSSDEELIKTKRLQTKLNKKFRTTDKNNSKIYVRRLRTSKFTPNGKIKKAERVWNQVHACFYCKKTVTNFSKHMRKVHGNEDQVKAINTEAKKLGPKHQTVRAMWDILRNEGDHIHNMKILKKGKGEIVLGRREPGIFDVSKYGPCPHCYVWIKTDKTLYRHQEICPALVLKNSKEKLGLRVLQIQSLTLAQRISSSASKKLLQEVYPIMTKDEISDLAQNEPHIVSLGNLWLLKNAGNRLKRKYYTSSRMRGAARLLLNIRKLTSINGSFEDFLHPKYFDTIVQATLLTASPDMDDEEDLKSPSTALKLGYDIKRLIGAKWGMALRNGDVKVSSTCKDLLKLMKFEWSIKVSKAAAITLQMRRFNKEKPLPEPDDLFRIQTHVKQEIQCLDLTKSNFETFRRASILGQTRLLLYNKRRSGEVEVISVKDYMRRTTGTSEIDRVMREKMSPLEIKLLECQDLMEVRGKFGRGVPVIVPSDLKKLLAYLVNSEIREKCGILSKNTYLFPNTSLGVIRSYESLKKICGEIELRKPEKITSVNLRKYTATISQVFDLNGQQQQWLSNHLGHSIDIHRIHYRQTSGLIERVDMAKLMLMQELNITSKYAGKKLEDIQLPEVISGYDQEDQEEIETENENEFAVLNDAVVNENDGDDYQPNMLANDTHDEFEFEEEDDNNEDCKSKKKSRSKGHHEMALKDENDGTTVLDDNECVIAVLLTNHLLSPLIPGHDYVIDETYQDKPTYCPCYQSKSCRIKINYGRTSIGNSRMWYGYPDVVLLLNTVMVEPDFKQGEKENGEVYNLKEEKRASEICELETNQNLNNERIASQIISQTITISLYTSALRQRKPELQIPNISLIPSLILTPSTYCIYMYDNKYDVLLTSGPNPTYLWDDVGVGYQFNKSAIMHLWMTLNHFQLLPSLDPAHIELIKESSNFHKLCEMNGLELPKIADHILFKSKFVRPEKFGQKNRNTKRLESSRHNKAHVNSMKKKD